jgi:hypothetical protein
VAREGGEREEEIRRRPSVAASKLLAKHGSCERGRYRGAAAQVREDDCARTAARGRGAAAPLSLPIPFLPMLPLFFLLGSQRRWAPLVNPHTPLPRRGSRGFGWRVGGAGLPNRLAAKPAPLSYISMEIQTGGWRYHLVRCIGLGARRHQFNRHRLLTL